MGWGVVGVFRSRALFSSHYQLLSGHLFVEETAMREWESFESFVIYLQFFQNLISVSNFIKFVFIGKFIKYIDKNMNQVPYQPDFGVSMKQKKSLFHG